MGKKLLLAAIWLSIFAFTSFGQLAIPEIAEHESGIQKIQLAESEKTLYNFQWHAEKFTKDNKTFIKFEGRGDNATEGKGRIDWTEESLIEVTPSGVRSIYWKKKSTGAEQMTWLLQYDWENLKAHYSWSDALSGKKEDKILNFEKGAIAGDSLNLALRGFPFEKGKGYKFKTQIILSDGTVLDGYIIHRGSEKLKTAFGELDTYKLELKPTGAIGVVAPKMYIWFTKSVPHVWLRFDGKEEGPFEPRTKNVLLQYSPSEWIRP